MRKFFNDVKNIKELKKRYFKLCKEYHTDNGGDKEKFVEMKNEYEEILKDGFESFEDFEETKKETYSEECMSRYAEVIDKIIGFKGIEIEIVGDWIWLSGNTYLYREQLKEYHFFYSKGKKKWYWNGESVKKKRYSKMSYEKIKERYGSTKVKTKESNVRLLA